MNRKVLIVGGIALAAATAATLFFYTILSDRIGGSGEAPRTGLVAVAAQSLPRGVKLAAADIEIQTRPLAEIPSGSFRSVDQLEGLYLAREVMAGRPITASSLPAEGKAGVSAVIPPGMRAVSLHVEGYLGVNRLLGVGDRVDVLAANALRSPGRSDISIATVLQNVEVLATDRDADDRQSSAANVTVLVNADQAGLVTLADHSGEIRLALRNPIDEAIIEAEDLRARQVLADSRTSRRKVRTADGANRDGSAPPAAVADDAPISGDAQPAADPRRASLED